MWRKGNPSALLVGMQTGTATTENSMEFPRKIKKENAFDPVIPFLGIYPKKPENYILIRKNMCTPMFIAASFTIAKVWRQPKCPSIDEWIKKLWYVYTLEFYEAIKKKELLPFVTARVDTWTWRILC